MTTEQGPPAPDDERRDDEPADEMDKFDLEPDTDEAVDLSASEDLEPDEVPDTGAAGTPVRAPLPAVVAQHGLVGRPLTSPDRHLARGGSSGRRRHRRAGGRGALAELSACELVGFLARFDSLLVSFPRSASVHLRRARIIPCPPLRVAYPLRAVCPEPLAPSPPTHRRPRPLPEGIVATGGGSVHPRPEGRAWPWR